MQQTLAKDITKLTSLALPILVSVGRIREPNKLMETKIDLVMCGHCEKMITPNLIASFGNDHHDPDEMSCEDCFNGLIARAELANNGD